LLQAETEKNGQETNGKVHLTLSCLSAVQDEVWGALMLLLVGVAKPQGPSFVLSSP
jgi:hypothetical protein